MGLVYKAQDRERNIAVALKELLPIGMLARSVDGVSTKIADRSRVSELKEILAAFRHDIRKLAALRHASLATIHDLCESGGTLYVAMEHVEGLSLASLMSSDQDRCRSQATFLLVLLRDLAEALVVLHEVDLIHGDIKPDNILVRPNGRPVLVDYGTALRLANVQWSSPPYAAPEQQQGRGEIGPRTDIYNLAAVAWRLIAGMPPPDAISRLQGEKVASLVRLGATQAPLPLLEALDASLALEAKARPKSAIDFLVISGLSASAFCPAPVQINPGLEASEIAPTRRFFRLISPPPLSQAEAIITEPSKPYGSSWWVVSALLAFLFVPILWYGGERLIWSLRDEWLVDPNGKGNTRDISTALMRARTGATLLIRPGVYPEYLELNRSVILRGLGARMQDIVIAPPAGEACAVISAEEVAIYNLTLRQQGSDREIPCLTIKGRWSQLKDIHIEAC